MRNRTTTMILVAVLMIAFATMVVASTLSADGGSDAGHTMPDGRTMMDGEMP